MPSRPIFSSLIILVIALRLAGASFQFAVSPLQSNAWGASSVDEVIETEEEISEFYQYTDKDGVIHFADGIEGIPRHYRQRVIVRKEKREPGKSTKVRIVDRQIRVPVTFRNGKKTMKAILILDTGAAITCITKKLAVRLGIETERARAVSMGMADGSMVDIKVVDVDSLAVGIRNKSPFEIGILPKPLKVDSYDGYLGLDFLGQFQHRIDFRNSLIHWE